jgi:TRAP-type C4-dicarboxylate transport system substrate-binding protein
VAGHDGAAVATSYARQIGARGLILVIAVLAVGAVGCVDAESSTKAGGRAEPITLRIGTADLPGAPGADQVVEFARRVDELSGGELRIEPVFDAAIGGDWDQDVARLVVSGELDLGHVPARAWDTEGVTTLRALQAPFLVTSDGLLHGVVSDEVAETMLAGLDPLGVTGLALVPEGLRHVFSYGAPLLAPEDFDGIVVRVPTSDTSSALYGALGARASDFGDLETGAELAVAVADGTFDAMESGFGMFLVDLAESVAVGNVVLYPKANTLVVNSETFAALSDEDQELLGDAAAATRDWAIANFPNEAEAAMQYCRDGGTIVFASDSELDALRAVARPVYDELERDAATRRIIERLRELAERAAPAKPVAPCESTPPTAPAAVSTGATAEPVFPAGVYRAAITRESLEAAGASRQDAVDHAATWTLTFDDGIAIVADDATGAVTSCPGEYVVSDARVVVTLLGPGDGCGDAIGEVLFSAGWELDGDRLGFADVQSGHGYDTLIAALFGGTPFTRVD